MFKDEIPEGYRGDVELVARAGLIKGYPDGTWRGDNFLTRNEMATILAREIRKANDLDDLDLQLLLDSVANSVVQVNNPNGSLGSGVIVSDQGHILTNAHVVAGADACEVIWSAPAADPDKPSFIGPTAPVVARDEQNDLALLKLNWQGARHPVALAEDWADDDEAVRLHFGRSVYAQGSPLGFSGRVSRGIFNGIRGLGGQTYLDFGGAINPGNSGGPIFDGEGRLVGLVVAKLVDVAIEGFGLGIPLSRVKAFLASALGL